MNMSTRSIPGNPGPAKKVRELTGARTRIVWAQQQKGWDDFSVLQPDFKLCGFDTDDGRGVRDIIRETGSYANPFITPGGDRIIYTDNVEKTVNVVNFDGSGHRTICAGYAMHAIKDPQTGFEWVYCRPNTTKSWVSKSGPVTRRRIDKPRITEAVWEKSSITWNFLHLSPDGKRAAVCTPWPKAGSAILPNGRFREFDKGCWTCMAPDSSYRMWVFDGDHRHVKLYDKAGKRLHAIDIHTASGIKGWEIYHPRWSNTIRFITVNGPYSANRKGSCPEGGNENLITSGGKNIDLYIGRLSPSLTKVESWVRITDNDKADFHGDAWIAPV
jgi:hypothetical protein